MPSADAPEALRALCGWGGGKSGSFTEYSREEAGRYLDIGYRSGVLTISSESTAPEYAYAALFEQRIGGPGDGFWSDEETTVYLFEIHRALLTGALDDLRVPTLHEARGHPMFIKGLVPQYEVGLHCERPTSGLPPDINSNDRRRRRKAGLHDHDHRCFVTVPAMDVAAWIEANPEQHRRFRSARPHSWAEYERGQRTTVDASSVRSW